MRIRWAGFKKVVRRLLLYYGMFGASGKGDDFPAAAIFLCRVLTAFFSAEQKFQNCRNSYADLQNENKHALASKE